MGIPGKEAKMKSGLLPSGRWSAATLLLAVFGLLLSAPPAGSQNKGLTIATGRLLVASERILDPRFQETVILLVNYDREGAMGLILNRPTRISIGEGLQILPELAEGAYAGDPIYYGGPVALNLPLALLKTPHPPDNSKPVNKDLVLTGPAEIASRFTGKETGSESFRIFAGYSGWGAGQLEGEIGRGDWQVRPFDPEAIFARDSETLWEKMRAKEERIWI